MNKVLEIGGDDCKLVMPGVEMSYVDCRFDGFNVQVAKWGRDRLPFSNDYFDLVYASHVIEHIDRTRTQYALDEAYRVLKPGGQVELWTLDFNELAISALTSDCSSIGRPDWKLDNDSWLGLEGNPHDDPMVWLNARLFSYSRSGADDDPNLHRQTFDAEYLIRCLMRSRFSEARTIDNEKPRTRDHGLFQLGVRGTK